MISAHDGAAAAAALTLYRRIMQTVRPTPVHRWLARRLLIFTLFWKAGSNLAPDNLMTIAGKYLLIIF